METRRRSPVRLIAPLAIVAAAIALVLVVSSSGGSGGGGSGGASSAEKAKDLGPTTASDRKKKSHSSKKNKLPQDVYVVKRGDTLGDIASRTGIPVERLQELNPGLDQFSLVAGQRIKLR
jgi:LysM repeat protein